MLPAMKAAIQPHLGALRTLLMGTCDVSSGYKPEVGVVAALILQVLTSVGTQCEACVGAIANGRS
jgi:hypothetical protein